MHNFSGILFRIWGECGIFFLLGVVCILFKKPWKKDFKILKCKLGLITVGFSVCLSLFYASRIIFPDVSSYTGKFIETYRDSHAAPPLPVTYKHVFWNGDGKRQGFYLDTFSKKEIFPYEFTNDQNYTIYYDELTNVITKVEIVE